MLGTIIARRLLFSSLLSGGALIFDRRPCSAEADQQQVRFLADDRSFAFDLPTEQWVGATRPEEERANEAHLISVRAARRDGSAYLQAIVDGGSRGRRYGASIADLGTPQALADRLVSDELLADDAAKAAAVVSSERMMASEGTAYYVIRYQVDAKPRIAKLAVVQQRLYCLRVRATAPAPSDFFDAKGASGLRAEMEAIAESFGAFAVNLPCVAQSNSGRVPSEGMCRVMRTRSAGAS
jgi:hypothetical protein